MTKLDEALREARGTLEPGEPEILMAHVLGSTRSWLYAHGDSELPRDVVERFAALVADRRDGIPVAYLTGRRGFRDLDLAVTPAGSRANANSTSSSVSGRGISVAGVTARSRSRKPRRPVR